jgi:small conductance mechanosensitive channel
MDDMVKKFLELPQPATAEKFVLVAIVLVLLILCTKVVNRLVRMSFKKIIEKTEDIEVQKQLHTATIVVTSSITGLIIILALFYALNVLGVDIRPLLATAGVVGIALGFGAKRFVEDVISGVLILTGGQAMVGDIVQINGISGTVEHVNLRLVILRSPDGTVHYIRNGLIDIISNSTREFSMAVFEINLDFKQDIPKVIDAIKQAGAQLLAHEEFGKYVILQNDDNCTVNILGLDRFEQSALVMKFNIKTVPAKQFVVRRAFNLMLKEKFEELGISIPYPYMNVKTQ